MRTSQFGRIPRNGTLSHVGDPAGDPESAAAPAGTRARRWPRRVILSLVMVAIVAVALFAFSWGSYRLEHIVVDAATVKGRLHKIGARLDGQVKTVEVQPGERVARDQVLIRLEDGHCVAAAREAQAQVQAALKRLEVEQLSIAQARRQLTLDVEHAAGVCQAAAGDLEVAISTRTRWEREHDRIQSLRTSGVSAEADMDNARAQRDTARAAVKVAEGRLAASETSRRIAGLELEGLRVREAGLGVLSADAELARQRLARCEADVAALVIRAPADGWVIDRIVEPGGSAKVGDPMMSLWLGAPWVEAWVDEKLITRIKVGSLADVTLTAYPDCILRGEVESIGVVADRELQAEPVPSRLHALLVPNAMIPIRIAVPGNQVRLQPGLSAMVGIRHETTGLARTVAGGGQRFRMSLRTLGFPSRPALGVGDQQNSKLGNQETRPRKD